MPAAVRALRGATTVDEDTVDAIDIQTPAALQAQRDAASRGEVQMVTKLDLPASSPENVMVTAAVRGSMRSTREGQ